MNRVNECPYCKKLNILTGRLIQKPTRQPHYQRLIPAYCEGCGANLWLVYEYRYTIDRR